MSEEGGRPGVRYKDGETSVEVSEDAVKEIINVFRGLWSEFWAWSAENPLLFALILLFLAVWISIRSRERIEKVRLKGQYNAHREEARISAQQELPLERPSPPGRQE